MRTTMNIFYSLNCFFFPLSMVLSLSIRSANFHFDVTFLKHHDSYYDLLLHSIPRLLHLRQKSPRTPQPKQTCESCQWLESVRRFFFMATSWTLEGPITNKTTTPKAAPNLLLLFLSFTFHALLDQIKNRSQNGGTLSRTKTRNMWKGKFERRWWNMQGTKISPYQPAFLKIMSLFRFGGMCQFPGRVSWFEDFFYMQFYCSNF